MHPRLNVLLLLVSILLMAACTNESQRRLEEFVSSTQAKCPITMSEGVTIDDVTYQDNWVTYHVTSNSPMLSVAVLKANESVVKPTVLQAIKTDTNAKVHDEIGVIREAKAGLKIIISDNDDQVQFDFTNAEL